MVAEILRHVVTEGKLTVCVSSIRDDTKSRWLMSGKTGEISFLSVILSGSEGLSSTALRGRLEGRAVVRYQRRDFIFYRCIPMEEKITIEITKETGGVCCELTG